MQAIPRLKNPQLANLSKAPTPLKSVNNYLTTSTSKFRHTTPGSGLVLVTKYKPQPTSELFDPSYPGAHLPLGQRQALTLRWVSKHFNLYAFPKAFLSKPDAPYSLPYVPRPYPARPQRPEQRSVDMSMQVVAFNSRITLGPTVRTKLKRRIKEAIRLIVTRGAAVEESGDATPRVVFRPEDVGAEKWIVPGDLAKLPVDWTYVALPTTEMFRMPFTEQLDLMRKALESIRRRVPDVEKTLRNGERQVPKSGNSVVAIPIGWPGVLVTMITDGRMSEKGSGPTKSERLTVCRGEVGALKEAADRDPKRSQIGG
ncbi:hypothetical protein H4582DRAFT_2057532 [Lactarius indigo]|nr:hypothetical protein H4582DRAFT_2057532 [Lactarius indigo]